LGEAVRTTVLSREGARGQGPWSGRLCRGTKALSVTVAETRRRATSNYRLPRQTATDGTQGLQVVENIDYGFHETPPVPIRQRVSSVSRRHTNRPEYGVRKYNPCPS